MPSLGTYCVTHKPPAVPSHLVDCIIGIGDFNPSGSVDSWAGRAFWDGMQPYAFSAGGNYSIPARVAQAARTELTGIFSYDKFIVRTRIGQPSTAVNFCQQVDIPEATRIPREAIEPRPGHEFLVGMPLTFTEGVVTQYINSHRGVDLFDYMSLAVEIGVLSFAEANVFASEEVFIPGGCEFGVYPTLWVCSALERVEKIGRAFLTRCVPRLQTYDGFQVRAVEFLGERLGSFLLMKELKHRYPDDIPPEVFGFPCAIAGPAGPRA